MKKLKYILLSLCIMSSPILANNELSFISPTTYEGYVKTGIPEKLTYDGIDFENADDYYVWEISEFDYTYQVNTGTYWYANCVPTTFKNLIDIIGIEQDENVQEIKTIMKSSSAESELKKGVTIEQSIKYLTQKNIPFETIYSITDENKLKELIRENLIVTNVAMQYVDDYTINYAKEHNDVNSYNYNHCVLMVGYQEIDSKLQLLILDTDTLKLYSWDYDKWKMAYERWSKRQYDNKLILVDVNKIKNEDINELLKTKAEEYEIAKQEKEAELLRLEQPIPIYPIF